MKSSRVEVPKDDEDFDTAMSYTITVTVRNYLGQVRFECIFIPVKRIWLTRLYLMMTGVCCVQSGAARRARITYCHDHG